MFLCGLFFFLILSSIEFVIDMFINELFHERINQIIIPYVVHILYVNLYLNTYEYFF